jgi:hypothetical protein
MSTFVKEFSKHEYHSWREKLIQKIVSKLRKLNEEKLKEYYEQILGEKPEPELFIIEPKITLSDDHVVAIVPAGTINKKIPDDEHLDRLRRGLVRIYRKRPKRKIKAKPMKYYKEKADKNETIRIGKARFKVNYVLSAIRTLGKNCYMYPPQKNSILVLENGNRDWIFIAPLVQ